MCAKRFDLLTRTYQFAADTRKLCYSLRSNSLLQQDTRQLIRSSGSVGANYIEADEALSRKDFVHRLKICRKEAKESKYWLELIDQQTDQSYSKDIALLQNETQELIRIFSAIIRNTQLDV